MKKNNEFYTEKKMNAYNEARLKIRARKLSEKNGLDYENVLNIIRTQKITVSNNNSRLEEIISDILNSSDIYSTQYKKMASKKNTQRPESKFHKQNVEKFEMPRIRQNAGGMITLSETQRLPPYRRGINSSAVFNGINTTAHKIATIVPNTLQSLLLTVDEKVRNDFVSWCSRQGKIPNGALFLEFKKSFARTSVIFEKRNYKDGGWAIIRTRNDQEKFRQDVLDNWEGKCAVTGSALTVEACHIVSHANKGSPSVENGIALAADLHRLFDSGHLRFKDGRVVLSEEARNDPRYGFLDNAKIRVPICPVNFPE